jgi:hypothetical protein
MLAAQPGDAAKKARFKQINLEERVVTLTVGGKDADFHITDKTQVLGAQGKDLKERFKDFKPGAAVMFKSAKQDGKEVLLGIKLDDTPPLLSQEEIAKLTPLSELGPKEYKGFQGGFYPGGKNERPAEHEAAGLDLAKHIRSVDAKGRLSPDGKIVLLSVGMSNTGQASQGFLRALQAYKDKNPNLLFVNGAVGGMTASVIQNPDAGKGADYWATVDKRLKDAGVTHQQVQVVWIKEADAGPKEGFPGYAKKLQAELTKIVQLLAARFPNLTLVYLSSRTFGGYASTPLNPEPYAFESGFSVKWLIEEQIKGEPSLNHDPKKGAIKAPWLSWGPYLWANGTTKRADGFSYDRKDFTDNDGTHLTQAGMDKVGRLMLEFFKTDSTTRPWFCAKPLPPDAPAVATSLRQTTEAFATRCHALPMTPISFR